MTFSFGSTTNNAPGSSAAPAFSFGAGATTSTAAAPAPTTFSFGATTPAAPASNTPAAPVPGTSNPPSTSFSFGASASTPATAPTPASSFGFGASATTPAPATTPATSFAFGANAATPAQTPAPGAGTPVPPPALPAPALPAPTLPAPTLPATPSSLQVPLFDEAFPGLKILDKITAMNESSLRSASSTEKDEYSKCLTALLTIPQLWKQVQPDAAIRQRLQQEKKVLLPLPVVVNSALPSLFGYKRPANAPEPQPQFEVAALDDDLLKQVFQLADDLRISETEALSLLHHSMRQGVKNPEQLFWKERSAYMQALSVLLQSRLESLLGYDEDNADSVPKLVEVSNPLLQQGLIDRLLELLRDYTNRIDQLLHQRQTLEASTHRNYANSSSLLFPPTEQDLKEIKNRAQVLSMHIDFAIAQRQAASECLFYLAYQTHWTSNEIMLLFNTIRDLSNGSLGNSDNGDGGVSPGLAPLDPYDVPSAYQTKEKSKLSPDPQTAALWMMDPWGHRSNTDIEEKNPFLWQAELVHQTWKRGQVQFLRVMSTLVVTALATMDHKNPLYDRGSGLPTTLGSNSVQEVLAAVAGTLNDTNAWKRPHVLGVLLVSYALSLQESLGSQLGSLSPHSFTTGGTGRSPVQVQEARRNLKRALESPTAVRAFSFVRLCILPVLQMPGCPISEFLLSIMTEWTSGYLRTLHRFNDAPISRAKWLLDAEEDLRLRRSDQEQSRQFEAWSGTRMSVAPVADAVNVLERPDCMDDVLALCHQVCLLGPNYASLFWNLQKEPRVEVLEWLEKIVHQDESLRTCYLDMITTFALNDAETVFTLLSDGNQAPLNDGATSVGTPNVTTNILTMRWINVMEVIRYYTRELMEGSPSSTSRTASRGQSMQQHQSTKYYYFDTNLESSRSGSGNATTSSAPSSQPRELGEENEQLLSAYLQLIEAVASRSPAARSHLRGLALPILSNDGMATVGQDSVMVMLFALATTAITPEIRGQVFETLASVMADSAPDEIRQAWELLENSSFVPIYKLLVYPTPLGEGDAPGILFPPSSIARVNEKHCKSWIPADPSYDLIYEMEYIEASRGVYPSTLGFLRLLREIIAAGGCPADVGKSWRSRTGCTPYIEYIIQLILPRVTGSFPGSLPALPFRSNSDRDRLLAVALDAVATCLRRYVVPHSVVEGELSLEKSMKNADSDIKQMIVVQDLVERILNATDAVEFKSFGNDFSKGPPSTSQSASSQLGVQSLLGAGVPLSKSPGFTIIAELISREGSPLLTALVALLDQGPTTFKDAEEYVATMAAFGPVRPTIASARTGQKKPLRSLLAPLRSQSDDIHLGTAFSSWEKYTTMLMEILCSVALREARFTAALENNKGAATIIPVLRFRVGNSAPTIRQIQARRIGQLITETGRAKAVVELIGYLHSSAELAAACAAFLFYIERMGGLGMDPAATCKSFSRRIMQLANSEKESSIQLLESILKQCRDSLRKDAASTILGIPHRSEGLDAIVKMVKDKGFLISRPRAAALCLEIIYHCMHIGLIADRVSSLDFWTAQLATSTVLLSDPVWKTMSWVFSGLAAELNLLLVRPRLSMMISLPPKYQRIVGALFESDQLLTLVRELPLTDATLSDQLTSSLHTLLGATVATSVAFKDTVSTSGVVEALMERLWESKFAATSHNLARCVFLLVHHALSVTFDDPGKHVDMLARLVSRGGAVTGVVAATLANVLSRSSAELPKPHSLVNAAAVLIRLSCENVKASSLRPTAEALNARYCLKTLLPLIDNGLVHRLLMEHGDFGPSTTPMKAWVDLLASMDSDIASLLEIVSHFPFGTDLLLNSEILQAIDRAGEAFAKHFASLENSNLHTDRLGIPIFWHGHIELMTLLMLRTGSSRKKEVAHDVLRILARYEYTAEKLLSSFPIDGDTTQAYVRCCVIAEELATSKHFTYSSSQSSVPSQNSITLLALHITEHPFPIDILGKLPATMRIDEDLSKSDIVHVAAAKRSWWEHLGTKQLEKNTSTMFFHARSAAEIAREGLSILRDQVVIEKLDCHTVARALIRCVQAVQFTAFTEMKLAHEFGNEPNSMVSDNLASTRKLFTEVVLELLRITSVLLESIWDRSQVDVTVQWQASCAPFLVALDYTRIDSMGMSAFGTADENKRDNAMELGKSIRTLIKQR